MAKKPLTVTFAIGRNTRHYDAKDLSGSRLLSDAIMEEATNIAAGRVKVRVDRVQRNLAKVVETEYNNAIQFAADRMMGTTSRGTQKVNIADMIADVGHSQLAKGLKYRSPDSPGVARFKTARAAGAVEWAPLSKRMVLTQHGMTSGTPPGPGHFFVNSGGLRATFKSFGRAMVKRTGVVSVRRVTPSGLQKFRASTKEVQVSRLRITLMPNVYPSHLPGLKSGNIGQFDDKLRFERSLGLPSHLVDQLYGPGSHVDPNREKHRPLLQPIMTYWTLVYVPNRVATVLQRAVVTNAAKGVAEFSLGT